MNAPIQTPPSRAAHGMPFVEFVVMMASLMAVNALGIDMMLPALGRIGHDLGVHVENHQQLVIAVYIGSFGVGQLFWGPLADRYGRRTMLIGAMGVYAVMSFIAAHAGSFELLLGARALQGISAASTRVLVSSIIRDSYEGRLMAKVMSLSFMVFLAVPVIAPSLGQLLLLIAPWHWIFYFLGGFSLCVAFWAWLRLPETLDPANRRAISAGSILAAARVVLTDRYSIGYTLASGCMYGGMIGYLSSAQQIVTDVFGAPQMLGVLFATIGSCMATSSLISARLVERLGMRMLAHSAMLALIVICLIRLGLMLSGRETLVLFIALNGLSFFVYGLIGSNVSAMAMEPMAHLAGTASSIQGFIQTMIGSAVGLVIGQSFAGTTFPLTLGWELVAVAALILSLITERGRLFQAHHRPS